MCLDVEGTYAWLGKEQTVSRDSKLFRHAGHVHGLVNGRNRGQYTPLELEEQRFSQACRLGYLELVQWMIQHNPSSLDHSQSQFFLQAAGSTEDDNPGVLQYLASTFTYSSEVYSAAIQAAQKHPQNLQELQTHSR